jgi:murein DD-endopeptidase MepM/ murein hydrolase activator NlpD
MSKTLGSSLLAGVIASVVAFLIPAVNPRVQANLPVDITVNPLTMMADSMRTVTTALDNEISSLVASATEATEIIENGPVASAEAKWLGQRLHELRTELTDMPRFDDEDAFRLNDRIAMQQRLIDEIHTLLDQRNAIVEHLPTLVPAHGRFSSEFGYRVHPISGHRKMHKGIDIAAPTGTPIYAAASGTIAFSGTKRGFGNTVEVNHGFGYLSRYAHASRLLVKEGETVKRGQLIALVGSTGASTGAHLHFEVEVDSVHVDPIALLAPQVSTTPELADASHEGHTHGM